MNQWDDLHRQAQVVSTAITTYSRALCKFTTAFSRFTGISVSPEQAGKLMRLLTVPP